MAQANWGQGFRRRRIGRNRNGQGHDGAENFENGVLLKVFVEEGVEVPLAVLWQPLGKREVIEDIETPDPAVEVQAQLSGARKVDR